MHSKLTREELRIIEQTKKEGEIEARNNPVRRSPVKPLVYLVLIFTALAFLFKIFLSATA